MLNNLRHLNFPPMLQKTLVILLVSMAARPSHSNTPFPLQPPPLPAKATGSGTNLIPFHLPHTICSLAPAPLHFRLEYFTADSQRERAPGQSYLTRPIHSKQGFSCHKTVAQLKGMEVLISTCLSVLFAESDPTVDIQPSTYVLSRSFI